MASLARRYARAFADVIIDLRLDASQVRDELAAMVQLVEGGHDLRKVWQSPAVRQAEKINLLNAIVSRAGFETPVRNFMAVLIEHNRLAVLPEIARQFELELNQRLGFIEAEVASARNLEAEERTALELQVARLTGRKVRAQYTTDSRLLGGAVVRVGSTIYDGSVRGQLHRIKEQLTED